jgi:Rad3-related DNA helicase
MNALNNVMTLRLSVHDLVDFLLRTGDIDSRVFNTSTMREGTRLHAEYQNKQGHDYFSEVTLSHVFEKPPYRVFLDGKADGVFMKDGRLFIEEIKTTVAPLETFHRQHERWHLMQAACYGFIYADAHDVQEVTIRLVYIHQETEEIFEKSYDFTLDEITHDIDELIQEYLRFYEVLHQKSRDRQDSLKSLAFPFKNFRSGQRALAKYAFGVAQKQSRLYAEAPTGIGKTMSTLYPFVKSMELERNQKIFYLTAKQSGKEAAVNAIQLLRKQGASLSAVVLTAKEKICFTKGAGCNPDECPFAKGYYDKIKDVIEESLSTYDHFDYDTIVKIARKHRICPFELSLDLSLYVDIVVGDYNYVFDPNVYLRRFFEDEGHQYIALVDEAHNLVERARDMYSTSLDYMTYLKAKKKLTKLANKTLKKHLKTLSAYFNRLHENPIGQTPLMLDPLLIKLLDKIFTSLQAMQKELKMKLDDEIMEFYFECNRMVKLSELVTGHHAFYYSKLQEKEGRIVLFCLNPSLYVAKTLSQLGASVLFSATLSPMPYYLPMLGSETHHAVLQLPSPFPKENLCLMIAPLVSTRFKDRQSSGQMIASYIHDAVESKLGNYLIFFPSYQYLEQIRPLLKFNADVDILIQRSDMKAEEQHKFLEAFKSNPSNTTVGLVVLGGAFGEGIDLVDDRLIGCIVVGVGMPQLSYERDLIKEYFNKDQQDGFAFAYTYPGMNRVLQAMGRVIRSETDKGMILLLDDRYLTPAYKVMFQHQYQDYRVVTEPEEVLLTLRAFWKTTIS